MRIAFTHNVQVEQTEAQAEFDTPETVQAIAGALERLGHEVILVDVAGPLAPLVELLEGMRPDLVFNTAEGWRGRLREALYPALFEELGLPFTGSDAYACTLTLDKHLTKLVVADHGVPTPRWAFVTDATATLPELDFPLIVKPNFEGSSKGITADAIIDDPATLVPRLSEMLARYPDGVMVEEFIVGRDVVTPFIEGTSAGTGGVLPSADYIIATADGRQPAIYDFTLKHEDSDAVSVRAPAELPPGTAELLAQHARTIFRVLGVRDLGRIDWRVTEDGRPYFLEVNALPSLEPGAGIYVSAAVVGLETPEAVLGAVLESSCERHGLTTRRARRRTPLRGQRAAAFRVGLAHNLKQNAVPGVDSEAEYDSPETVDAIAEAIASFGHEVVPIEADRRFLDRITAARVDAVFNIAEGTVGRSREAVVPAVLELLDIPYTGSDATCLAVTLDKGLAKRLVREAGLATPDFAVFSTPGQRLPSGLGWPLIVKPISEGSSKGVGRTAVVRDEAELRERVEELIAAYRQPVLVEAFLPGREFTVGLLGHTRLRSLPPMEIVYTAAAGEHPIYAFEDKLEFTDRVTFQAPAQVDPGLRRRLERAARAGFRALGCRDVARIDLRLDAAGRVHFIECNPLPGLSPGFSDLCLIAESAGIGYRELIGEILSPALRRRSRIAATHRSSPAR